MTTINDLPHGQAGIADTAEDVAEYINEFVGNHIQFIHGETTSWAGNQRVTEHQREPRLTDTVFSIDVINASSIPLRGEGEVDFMDEGETIKYRFAMLEWPGQCQRELGERWVVKYTVWIH